MNHESHRVVNTPHARAWGGAIFGALFVAAYMALADDHPPTPRLNDPWGAAFCLVSVTLAIRSLRLGAVVNPNVLVIRGYLTTRRISVDEVDSLSIIDYPGPWWVNSDRLKGLRVNRTRGRRGVTAWGLTGSESRICRARAELEAELQTPLKAASGSGHRSRARQSAALMRRSSVADWLTGRVGLEGEHPSDHPAAVVGSLSWAVTLVFRSRTTGEFPSLTYSQGSRFTRFSLARQRSKRSCF